ncbi:MAG: hypothetical protein ACJ8F3_21350 [Xanthobacteraceae bacterium]
MIAAVEPSIVSASASAAKPRWPAWMMLLLIAASYVVTVLLFYPGYVTVDAQYVYAEAKAWQFGDWQSPVMGALWRLLDPIAPGAPIMFLLTITLYWAAFALLGLVAARRMPWLALATPVIAFLPPAFFFIGLIWRDILFGVIWLFAAVIAFAVAERPLRQRLPVQTLAFLFVLLGVLLRPNSVLAAPFLLIYIASPARLHWKTSVAAFAPLLVLCILIVPAVYYGMLGAKRQNPLHSILVFDLGGITHFTGENQFPTAWSADETALLTTRCYDPVRWDSYWHVPPCPFVMQRLERPDDLIFGTPRLPQAWRHAVLAHPLAYLTHRASFMWQFLARSNLVLPVWDWEKPNATYGQTPLFRRFVGLHDILQPTWLFRPGLWLLLALAVVGLGWRARGNAAGLFALSVSASGVVYVMSFFPLGVAADFRYAYWCVLAALAGAIALLVGRGCIRRAFP